MPWPRSGRRSPPGHHLSWIRARGGHANYRTSFWVAANEIWAKRTSLPHHFSPLVFRVSLNSAICRLMIFFSIKRCGILSLLTHDPVHIRKDLFSHWDLMCFQSVPLIFLSSVLFSILFSPLITYEPSPFRTTVFLLLDLLNFCFLCFFVLVVHGYAEKVQKRQRTTSSDVSQSVLVIWCKQKKMKSTHLYLCPDLKKMKRKKNGAK